MTEGEDLDGHFVELHNAAGELHYISRSYVDPEDARQSARDWAKRYKAAIYEDLPNASIPTLKIPFLTNRDPGDEAEP